MNDEHQPPKRIAILGDIHGEAAVLDVAVARAERDGAAALVQVGDFGVYENTRTLFERVGKDFPIPVYFLDGNHEDYRLMKGWQEDGEPREWVPNCWWVSRGYLRQLAGSRIGCLGGAASIDYNFRIRGRSWFPDEEITTEVHGASLLSRAQNGVDLLITHTPPQSIIGARFDPNNKRLFGAAMDWFDPSALVVENVWRALGRPPLVCGHMHEPHDVDGVRILTIAEYLLWGVTN
jgi:hypothetical protein